MNYVQINIFSEYNSVFEANHLASHHISYMKNISLYIKKRSQQKKLFFHFYIKDQ